VSSAHFDRRPFVATYAFCDRSLGIESWA
jgi:hypothetical protein